jgi:Fe-S cluster biogenesis protein NfuA
MAKKVNSKVEGKIQSALDEIRPYLQSDGGDISLLGITEDYEVTVKLMGACGNCPMSLQTLKLGVEKTIQKTVPQVKKVIAVDENLVNMFPDL